MYLELLTARYPGMRRWLTQRLCALSMALYLLLLLLRLCLLAPADFTGWQSVFSPLWWRLLTLWFFLCLAMHAWLGVRDVLRDYVPHLPSRHVIQVLADIALWLELLAVLWILFGLDF